MPSTSRPRLVALVIALAVPSALPVAAAPDPPPAASRRVAGTVRDPTGAVLPGASVALDIVGQPSATTVTDAVGAFVFSAVPPGPAVLSVHLSGFSSGKLDILPGDATTALDIVLHPPPVSARVTVRGEAGQARRTVAATRTDTPLRDIPQAVSIISRETMAAQGVQGLADLLRYVPGVGTAQGEGNRDAVVFRGNGSTGDFLTSGMRDDVQYYRDLYNVERVEVLKGPNAMLFGRGGAGGVLNRVLREANWAPIREVSVQAGSYGNRRATVDVGQALNGGFAGRLTAMYEDSDSYREGVGLERYGLNPTAAASLGRGALLTFGYERFHDERTADRGVPSVGGRPVDVDPATFFGDPGASRSRVDIHAVTAALDADVAGGLRLRARARYADHDKFYQNVYPTGVGADGRSVAVSAYNNATSRRNLLAQSDITGTVRTWSASHALLAGAEVGRQATTNLRNTGYFDAAGRTTATVDLDAPSASLGGVFRQSNGDADNRGTAWTQAVYVQDHVTFSRFLSAVAGVRYEALDVDFHNNRTGADNASADRLLSPRAAIIVKPASALSVYASYSVAYVPRAGEQLSSLTLSNKALDPERFRNYEVGAKWEIRPDLAATAAVYRLDRRNIAVPDPANPSLSLLVDGQEASGLELECNGRLNRRWDVIAGYAYQRGEVTRSLSANALAGARLAQLPAHTVSLWNKVDVTRRIAAALGIIRRGAMFTSTDNSVVVPGFTRVDAAAYVTLTPRLRVQANVENALDRRYFASAHSNQNIMPGSPRAVRVTATTSF